MVAESNLTPLQACPPAPACGPGTGGQRPALPPEGASPASVVGPAPGMGEGSSTCLRGLEQKEAGPAEGVGCPQPPGHLRGRGLGSEGLPQGNGGRMETSPGPLRSLKPRVQGRTARPPNSLGGPTRLDAGRRAGRPNLPACAGAAGMAGMDGYHVRGSRGGDKEA